MEPFAASLVFFSPTGTTKKILKAIARGMGAEAPALHDLTAPAGRTQRIGLEEGGVAVIGAPVYEEMVPPAAEQALRELKGRGNPAVLVAVYGNIGYGMALRQLKALAEAAGLRPVAAAAFIGEHSFSSAECPVAAGRPDAADLEKAEAFGRAVRRKLEAGPQAEPPDPPGRLPLMARLLPKGSARYFTRTPDIVGPSCNRCGACAKLCPAGAIDPATLHIDPGACIRCFCCVRRCPGQARKIVYKKRILVKTMLQRQGGKRKEPVIFL